MKNLFFLMLLLNGFSLPAQNDVRVGDNTLESNLVIEKGAVVVSNTANPVAGAIQFMNGEFMGYNGSEWLSLSPVKKEILGVSAVATNGAFSFGGETGYEAANEMCKAAFPNEPTARFYFSHDINEAVANGLISGVNSGQSYWSAMNDFDGSSSTNSFFNNCYLSNGSDGMSTGMTVAFLLNNTPSQGIAGNIVQFQRSQSCANVRNVICGK